ncbi:MAG: hypothetical protein U0869_14115 [Chloroflexota bacterium]
MSTPVPPDPAPSGSAARSLLLPALGVAYLLLGAVLGGAWLLGDVQSSLFPTGWVLPAVLLVSGALMLVRRRFDIVAVLWAGLALAVFQIDLAVYLDGQALGVTDPAAFDATVIVVALGLLPLVLRGHFRPTRTGV